MPTKTELAETNAQLLNEVELLEAERDSAVQGLYNAERARDAARVQLRGIHFALLPLKESQARVTSLLEELDQAQQDIVLAAMQLEVPEDVSGANMMNRFIRREA